MLLGYMDIARRMIHVKQVEDKKVKDREGFDNKRAKTFGNDYQTQKTSMNFSFHQKQKGPTPSSANTLTPINNGQHNARRS